MAKFIFKYIILIFAFSICVYGITPPKDGEFPRGFWDKMASQEIGTVYGDSGWVRKIDAWKSNSFRDAQLEFNIPVLLGKYNGATTYFTAQDFQNNLFDNNSTGTMSEYYREISHGNFIVDGTTAGWYESSYNMSQAVANTKQYVAEIAQIADGDFDYSLYDNDGPDNIPNSGDDDGYVDGIAVVYSGCGAEWGPGNDNLWPHMSSLGSSYEYTTNDASANGGNIIVSSYFVAPELAGGGDCYTDIIRPMGVYAHEFGHILGLPDLYDRNSDNGDSEGIGEWCLMASGSWNGWAGDTPAHMSAWCKQEMGWVDPMVLDGDQISVNFPDAVNNDYALKIWEDDYHWSRYFLVENRQLTGFDSGLPGDGLMIYHVDENSRWGPNLWSSGSVNDDHSHKLVDVEEADGLADLDNSVNRGDDGDPFPGSSSNLTFDSNSNPNSGRYNGGATSISLTNISGSSNTMSADITLEPQKGIPLVYDLTGISGWGWGYATASDHWGGVLFEYPNSEIENGYLTEVDIGFRTSDNNYTLYVYDSFDGVSPGTLLYETSGTQTESGWASVSVDSVLISPGQEFFIAYKITDKTYGISFDKLTPPIYKSYFSGDGVSYDGAIGQYYNINLRAKLRNHIPLNDIAGCTDPYASNYNPDANIDDGSCLGFPDNGDYSLSFGGDGDYTHLDWSENMSSYTISIWVKSNVQNQNTFDAFFNTQNSPDNGMQLDCNGSNNYRLHSEEGSMVIAPLSTEWSHIAVVAENSTTTVYFNGEYVNSSNWVENDWNQIELGRNRNVDGPGNYTVDDVRIWNTALSQIELQQEMLSEVVISENGLLVDWKLNSGSGDIIYDHSGNANHATNYNGTWSSDVPNFPEISVLPDQISQTLYIGESATQMVTIYNNGDSGLDWEIGFSSLRNNNQEFVLPEGFRNESYTMDPIATSTGDGNAFDANNFYTNSAIHQTRDESFNVFVYNNSNLSNIINEHPDLSSNYGSYTASTLEDVDVLFNIRSSNLIPEETLEWIYNGGTWIGEWSSNDYPINSWGVIGGSAGSGGCCTSGSVDIIDSDHWLAQNIDWDNVPVGSGSTQFQRFITIDDPDANVIIKTTVTGYGEFPLFVEKQYGDGTILIFNWDYQDSPQSNPEVVEMIKQVAYYGAAIAGGVNWLSFSEQNGTIPAGSSQDVELLLDATSLDEGNYDTEFFVLSNDPLQSAVGVSVQLEVETPTPDISVTPDSFDEILFVDELLDKEIIIQNAGVADLNWNLSLFNYGRDGSSYTFTNCDKEGNEGPSQQDCDSEYQGTNIEGFVTVDGGIQQWIVPASGTYTIEVHGAKGGDSNWSGNAYVGGLGAKMQGQFALEAGQILNILVGQKGTSSSEGGGGGGTYVAKADDTPLIVAGGGGGAGGIGNGIGGVTETSGTDGAAGGAGGADGNGGSVGNTNGGAGSGFYTDGASNHGGSKSYLNGGMGSSIYNWAAGGFGGGGHGWGFGGNGGGAGGYSGGGTSGLSYIGGGGGGSFNSGLDQNNIASVNADHGVVTITLDSPPISWATLSDNAGVTPAGESDTVTLALNANDLEIGEYSAGISLSSNDPDESDIDIPISITVINNVVITDIDDASIEEDSSLELVLVNDYGSYDYLYTVVTDTSAVVVSVDEDTLELTPIIDWTGTTNISVVLTLENSLSDTTDFNLTVTPVNDAPIAFDALYFVDEDDTLNTIITANDGDSLNGEYDDQVIEFFILEGFQNGTYSLVESTGEMTYTPYSDYFGSDSMHYFVIDNGVTDGVASPLADTAMIVVQILPVNDTPVLQSIQDTSLYEDGSLTLPVFVSDIDNDEVSLTVSTSNPENIYADLVDMMLYLTPSADWHDTVMVTLVASDNMDRALDIVEFELVVLPVNDAPNAYNDILYINEDEALQSILLADDGDTLNHVYDIQSLSFSVLEGFHHGSFELNQETGDYAYAPALNYFGSDSMLYMVEDDGVTGEMLSPLADTALIVVHTLPVNDEPVLTEISDTVMYEDSLLIFPISVSDVDNDEIDLDSYTSNEDYVTVIIEDGNIYLNSYFNWHDTVMVTVVANDNMGRAIDVEEFQLIVLPVNDTPEFIGEMHAVVGVGMDFAFHLEGFDIDMDPLTFSLDDAFTYPDWVDIMNDPFRLVGSLSDEGLFMLPILLTDGVATVVDSFQLDAQYFQPRISSIMDVPDDQGGRVYVEFQRSFFDSPEETNQFYTVSRLDSIDNELAWVGISTVSATGIESYVVEVSTLRDSTSFSTGITEFKVSAFTNYGVHHSDISMGYSIDNLAPMIPTSFTASIMDQNIVLMWNQSSAEDFDHYNLEKSHSAEFEFFEIITLDDTSYIDTTFIMNTAYFYRLSVADISGNMSEYTNIIEMTVLGIDDNVVPDEFALHQNYPNPFNPTTTIRYDIPMESRVLIQVFDIQGRLVKTLVKNIETPGKKSIVWDATNHIGEPVSAGMYLYLIQADGFKETRKMLLLK